MEELIKLEIFDKFKNIKTEEETIQKECFSCRNILFEGYLFI
jgi:hypothetical protein